MDSVTMKAAKALSFMELHSSVRYQSTIRIRLQARVISYLNQPMAHCNCLLVLLA